MSLPELLEKSYVGKKTEVFFEENGRAQSQYKMESGKKTYIWSSNDAPRYIPPTTMYNGTLSGNSFSGTGTTTGGAVVNGSCVIRILASPQKDIESISIEQSGQGYMFVTRCSQYFGKLRKKFKE